MTVIRFCLSALSFLWLVGFCACSGNQPGGGNNNVNGA